MAIVLLLNGDQFCRYIVLVLQSMHVLKISFVLCKSTKELATKQTDNVDRVWHYHLRTALVLKFLSKFHRVMAL